MNGDGDVDGEYDAEFWQQHGPQRGEGTAGATGGVAPPSLYARFCAWTLIPLLRRYAAFRKFHLRVHK